MRFGKNGFTLIELIIVIVIIGILASIAAPMLGNMKAKAICSEAVTGIATLRTSFNAYRLEYRGYPSIPAYRWLTNPSLNVDPSILKALGFEGAALDRFNGRYFSSNCFIAAELLYIFMFSPILRNMMPAQLMLLREAKAAKLRIW